MKATPKPRMITRNDDDRKTHKRKHVWKLGTWNVRTMLQAGKTNEIARELAKFKMDIVALQEIRWKNFGEIKKKEFTIYYSGTENKTGKNGTGFWLGPNTKNKVLGFEPVNDRLCKIRIKGTFNNVTLISAYAPTEDASNDEKDSFYTTLEDACNKVSKYDTLVILGDFNAKIGIESSNKNVAGKHSLHKVTSENGMRLCNFASATSTFIMSTAFPHKDIHKGTWKIPGSHKANQIDHALINLRRRSSIIDVRTLRDPNCDSDHFLVKVNLRFKLTNITKTGGSKKEKWNTNALIRHKAKHEFQTYIDKQIDKCELSNDIEEEWNVLKNSISQAAASKLGRSTNKQNSEWFDDDCMKAIEAKNKARKRWLTSKTRAEEEVYQIKRRIATKLCQKKKREAMKEELKHLCNEYNDKQSRKFYSKIRSEKRGFQPRVNMCRSKNGELLTEQQDIVKRWEEHFKELLNAGDIDLEKDETRNYNPTTSDATMQLPSIEEVNDAISFMKNCKAPGEDNITAELLKNASPTFIERLHHLITLIWNNEKMPDEWNTAIIIPIHKKGDKTNCKNYRGISLLNTTYKIFAKIVNKKLVEHAEKILPEYQCGFRPGRSTIDQIFALKLTVDKCYEHNIDLHMIFIDFKQAFDSISRMIIPTIFSKCNIPEKIMRLVMMSLRQTKSKVKIQDTKSDPFTIQSGVRQGDTLSSTVFNLMLCYAIDEVIGARRTGHILNRTTQIFAYADDIAIVSKNMNALTSTFSNIETAAAKIGLKINEDKTKYMLMTRGKNLTPTSVQINNYNFETVDAFTYLGFKLTNNNCISATIDERIQIANKSYWSLTRLFRSKLLNRPCKLCLYKTIVRPVLCYGCEVWTISEKEKAKLVVFERKILRQIYGPIRDADGEWRIRWNDELEELIKGENVIRFIKSQRIRWIGHVSRMDDMRAQKKILEAKTYIKKARGRPKSRWIDEVEDDIRNMKVVNWRKVTMNRDAWRSLVQQAKAHKEL